MKNTDEQNEIIEASLNSKSLVVNALAGSGKTSTAINCIIENTKRYPNSKIIYLCFNKSVAETMKAKLAEKRIFGPQITTLHSLAYRHKAVPYMEKGRSLGNLTPFDITEMTKKAFLHNVHANSKTVTDSFILNRCRRLALDRFEGWCKSPIFELKEFLKTPSTNDHKISIKNFMVEESSINNVVELIWKRVLEDPKMKFPHSVYLKLFQLEMPSLNYDLAIVDEAQDLIPVNESVIKQISEEGSRLMFLGDRYQQIYTWNGSVNSMQRFESNSDVLSLTQSFRCPEAITELAERYLKILGFKGTFKPASAPCKLKHKSPIIISRTNASLLSNISSSGIKDKEIHLLGGAKSYNFDPVSDYLNFRNGKKEYIKSLAVASFKNEAEYVEYAESTNNWEMISAKSIVDSFGAAKVYNILDSIKKGDFAEEPDSASLCLSTGHKCKGSEFENVIIDQSFKSIVNIGNGEVPEKESIQDQIRTHILSQVKDASEDATVYSAEELRLAYVALTRSTDLLTAGPLGVSNKEASLIIENVEDKNLILYDLNEYGNLEPLNKSIESNKSSISMKP